MAPYTIRILDSFGRTIEEKTVNYITDVVNFYFNSIDIIKIYDAHGAEIPEDMLIF